MTNHFRSYLTALLLVVFNATAFETAYSQEDQSRKQNLNSAESDPSKELTQIVSKMAELVETNDIGALEKFMTKKGQIDFTTELLFTFDMYLQPLDEGHQEEVPESVVEAIRNLKEIAKEHKLDKIDTSFPANVETEAGIHAYGSKLLETLGSDQQRVDVLKKILVGLRSLEPDLNPFVGKVTTVKRQRDYVSVSVSLAPEPGEAGDRIENENDEDYWLIHRFVKSGNRWKWDGYDDETMNELDRIADARLIPDAELTGIALSGKQIDLKDYHGKYVLIDFWGTWCEPCVAELPHLALIHNALQEHGFEIIGVAADDKETLEKFIRKNPLVWENVIDGDMKTADRFKVNAFPTTFLIDREGVNVAKNVSGAKLLRELIIRMNLKESDFAELRAELRGENKKESSGKGGKGASVDQSATAK